MLLAEVEKMNRLLDGEVSAAAPHSPRVSCFLLTNSNVVQSVLGGLLSAYETIKSNMEMSLRCLRVLEFATLACRPNVAYIVERTGLVEGLMKIVAWSSGKYVGMYTLLRLESSTLCYSRFSYCTSAGKWSTNW